MSEKLTAIPGGKEDGLGADLGAVREEQKRKGHNAKAALPLLETTDDPGELLRRFNGAFQSPAGRAVAAVTLRGEQLEAELEDGREVRLGTAEHVLDPRKMDARLAPSMDHEPPYFTPKEWRALGFCLIRAASEDPTAAASEAEETKEWIAGFLENPTALPGGGGLDWTLEEGVALGDGGELLYDLLAADAPAFRGDDRRLYLRPGKLLKFVNTAYGQRTTRADLIRRLSRLGFTKPRNKEGMIGARPPEGGEEKGLKPKTRRYFASPPDFNPER